jgi:hypothetical protein
MIQCCSSVPFLFTIRAHRNDLSPSLLSYRGIPFHELSKPSDWIDVYTYLQPALLQRLLEETRTWNQPPQLHPERTERRTGAGGGEHEGHPSVPTPTPRKCEKKGTVDIHGGTGSLSQYLTAYDSSSDDETSSKTAVRPETIQ